MLTNIFNNLTGVNNFLYTGSDYYTFISKVFINKVYKPFYGKLSFPEKVKFKFL